MNGTDAGHILFWFKESDGLAIAGPGHPCSGEPPLAWACVEPWPGLSQDISLSRAPHPSCWSLKFKSNSGPLKTSSGLPTGTARTALPWCSWALQACFIHSFLYSFSECLLSANATVPALWQSTGGSRSLLLLDCGKQGGWYRARCSVPANSSFEQTCKVTSWFTNGEMAHELNDSLGPWAGEDEARHRPRHPEPRPCDQGAVLGSALWVCHPGPTSSAFVSTSLADVEVSSALTFLSFPLSQLITGS